MPLTSATAVGFRVFGASELPEGVMLQEIDGGPTYYADNGYTYAVGMGWDDPTFFPIAVWNGNVSNDSDADRLVDLGINTLMALGPSFMDANTFSRIGSRDISLVTEDDDRASADLSSSAAYWVGNIGVDEATAYNVAFGTMAAATANAKQDARFWYWNGNWFFFLAQPTGGLDPYEAPESLTATTATPNATTRHIDIASTDAYWFAGADATPPANLQLGELYGYGSGNTLTTTQARRACRYGDLVDFMRDVQADGFPAPIAQFIENGGPYETNTTGASYITPAEMNAAIWASIIHGCRIIIYFNHTFGGPAAVPDISTDNFGKSYFQTIQSGETISIYNQGKATNADVAELATVINSPFAVGYATVSPPAVVLTPSVDDSGFDMMVKYHNVAGGDNKFYIFAMPRLNTASQNATFTIANTGATQVTVINESRTISVTGGTTFSDNFATGNTVHIYRVD
jgi:hypothetical protein